jgi:hypothetical protein
MGISEQVTKNANATVTEVISNSITPKEVAISTPLHQRHT